MMEF